MVFHALETERDRRRDLTGSQERISVQSSSRRLRRRSKLILQSTLFDFAFWVPKATMDFRTLMGLMAMCLGNLNWLYISSFRNREVLMEFMLMAPKLLKRSRSRCFLLLKMQKWETIKGLENAKQLLKEAVVMPIKYPN